jgi:DNA mismatch repair protein MutL
VLGREAAENLLEVSAKREGASLSGFASLPSFNRGQANHAYFFVNGRPVRDKLLLGSLKAAYADLLMKGRHPVTALYLECPPEFVDVNVHPAKAEVRFRDPGLVRSLIVGTLKSALADGGRRTATGLARAAETAFRPEVPRPDSASFARSFAGFAPSGFAEEPEPLAAEPTPNGHPLGAARAQFHENYILSQTADGIVIVDQHAAHERLVYERMKAELKNGGIAGQPLLIPEVVELDPSSATLLAAAAETLARLSLVIEPFGAAAVLVREVPAALADASIASLLDDLAGDLAELDASAGIEEAINRILATAACHHSVRSGRWLKPAEMDALLREMERTPNSGHCNHGRPTYVSLKLADIEKLFGRR